jgi:nucleotide-binding universal stress UspA family protein
MNTILIPTDFSVASENAMHYGAQLAQQLSASVVLAHIYQVPVSMNDMPVMVFSVEELKKTAEIGLDRCLAELQQSFPGLAIRTESRLGSIPEELNNLSSEVDPFVVVMGSHNTKGLERVFFGSTSASVIRHAHHPVLAVPASFKARAIKNIVLAADLENIPDKLSNRIIEIVQLLHAKLHIVHVKIKEETETPDALLEKLNALSPSYKSIANKKVKDGLLNYVQEVNADMLIFLPHEHNLVERLFFKVHTEEILSDTKIPLLAIKA